MNKTGKGGFKKGQSGNPAGRRKGVKNKITQDFLDTLTAHFHEHGADAIDQVYRERPSDYLKIIAQVIPKDIQLEANIQELPPLTREEAAAINQSLDERF